MTTQYTKDFYCDFVFSGKIKVDVVKETKIILAFHHTRPNYPFHVVIIPKKHITTLSEVRDLKLIKEIFRLFRGLLKKRN